MTIELFIMTVASSGLIVTSLIVLNLAIKCAKLQQTIADLRQDKSEAFMNGGSL